MAVLRLPRSDHNSFARKRTLMRLFRVIVALLIAVLASAGCGRNTPATDISVQTITPATSSTPTSSTPAPTSMTTHTTGSAPSSSTSTSVSTCVAGKPVRIVWPDIAIDAAFEETSLDTSMPADAKGVHPPAPPQVKTNMGWYKGLRKPGDRRGTVLILGHTWPDNSAVFKKDFDAKLRLGSEFTISTDTGGVCRYRVSLKLTGLDKSTTAYSEAVAKYNLYAATGPERVVGTTCTGRFDNSIRSHVANSVLVADLIN